MPRYTWINKNTKEIREDQIMSVAERDLFETENPEWVQQVAVSKFIAGTTTSLQKKLPEDFKEHLRRIKKYHKADKMEDFSSTTAR